MGRSLRDMLEFSTRACDHSSALTCHNYGATHLAFSCLIPFGDDGSPTTRVLVLRQFIDIIAKR